VSQAGLPHQLGDPLVAVPPLGRAARHRHCSMWPPWRACAHFPNLDMPVIS